MDQRLCVPKPGKCKRKLAIRPAIVDAIAAANIDPTGFSGHSLHAGFATSAVQAVVSTLKIRSQTGHASDAMLARSRRDEPRAALA
jgi:integrase